MQGQQPYWELGLGKEEEEEAYVPDDQLILADQLPPPPPLPDVTTVRCAMDEMAMAGPGRPVLAANLGRGRYVTVAPFQGKLNLHIREFGVNKFTLRRYPTPRGVCLDTVQVRSLLHHLEELRTRVHAPAEQNPTESNWHLGKLRFASFSPDIGPFIDFRTFFVPENEHRLQATLKGITLNSREFDSLAVVLRYKVQAVWPALVKYDTPCFVHHSEQNDEQNAKEACDYCSPLAKM